jgi:hypothetical protein
MNILDAWQQAIIFSGRQVWNAFVAFLPSFLAAVLLFVIGIFVASWCKSVVEKLLKNLGFENLASMSGFSAFLKKAEVTFSATELVGMIIKWVILLVFFIAAIQILGLTVVLDVLTSVLGYIPNVLAAALIFGAGFIVARLVDGLVRSALTTIDHEAARPIGRLTRWVVLVIAFFAALGQLQIAPVLVNTFFQGLTWTLVLIFGLSIGLGSKDFVAKLLDDWYKRLRK